MSELVRKLVADRIGGIEFDQGSGGYKFEKIKQAKREALEMMRESGVDRYFIDMGIGEPDEMAPERVLEELCKEAMKSENRGYADNGCQEFSDAVAGYMKRIYGVELDSKREILHSMGSKAALSILSKCFVNEGDVVLMTVPGYPVFGTHAKYLGGEVVNLPLLKRNDYLPDLEDVDRGILKKCKVLVINYPNNPTGAIATMEFFKKVIDFAHKNGILVIQDAAYSGLSFERNDKVSIMQVDGAKDVAIELHSLSKPFNMTGWRIGWVCGNELAVKAYGVVKNNTDSGQFLPIQKAGVKALADEEFSDKMAKKYRRRLKEMVKLLKGAGIEVEVPRAGFFCFGSAPKGVKIGGVDEKFLNADDACKWFIRNELICCVPWDDVEASLRFSATFSLPDGVNEEEFLKEFGARLGKYRFYN